MRNLLSFFFGLLSAALLMLIRLVLLIDRAVCFVWDAPCWPAAARAVRRLRASRLACALAAFVPVLVLPGALLTQPCMLVTADGQPLGLVENADELTAAVAELERSASSLSGEAYALPVALSGRRLYAPAADFLSGSALRRALIAASGELDTLAVISVDGERAGVCRSAGEAQTLLDRIKAQYTAAEDERAAFVQSVRVDNVVAQTALASDIGALYDTLAPQLDVTATREVTYTEHIPFGTVTRENDAHDQTWRETVREGTPGAAVVTAEIRTVDGEEQQRTILERTVLSQATDEIVEVGTRNIGVGTGEFAVPVSGYTFTSGFKWRWGRLHGGVDLAVDEGTTVYAADNGRVIVSEDSDNGYGRYIVLDHQNGYKTLYGHNSELLVSVGDIVAKGQPIARSGNTGNSTGPHLHFEVHEDDEKVDPTRFIAV